AWVSAWCRSSAEGARRAPPQESSRHGQVRKRFSLERALLRAGEFRFNTLRDERGELSRLGVQRRGLPRVAQHPRQVFEVLDLAVAIIQARKDSEHLDVPLQSHQVEAANELLLGES